MTPERGTRDVRRRRDWPERLAAWIESTREKPFAWGNHDCALWAAGAIREMTGIDPMRELRGRYSDLPGAIRALRGIAETLEDAVNLIAAREGYELVPTVLAQRGDLVLCPCPEPIPSWSHVLGICAGKVAMALSLQGLVPIRMSQVVRAWRV